MNNSTEKRSKLKVDFNLLMSGTWVLEKKGRQKIHCFEKEVNGGKIIIYNALDVPSPTDSKLLDYLMLKSQESDWSKEVVIPSISQIIKDLGLGRRKQTVDRIEKSLDILVNTRIKFQNCFIDTGVLEYFDGPSKVADIGLLQGYHIKKTKPGKSSPVKVVFDDNFLALCKNSLGYKLVPYKPIQGLRDTAYALYKWAYRWYDAKKGYGERWIGDGKALVKWYKNELNSTANYKYPSKVIERVNSAITQLNANDKVPFSLELKKENGRYKMAMRAKGCVIKVNEPKSKSPFPYDNLPESDRNALLHYVKENMKHIKNPYGFLRSMSEKELRIFMRRVTGKKVLVSAGSKPAEEPSLKDKLSSILKAHGIDDFDITEKDIDLTIYVNPKEREKLESNHELMDLLRQTAGKPVWVLKKFPKKS